MCIPTGTGGMDSAEKVLAVRRRCGLPPSVGPAVTATVVEEIAHGAGGGTGAGAGAATAPDDVAEAEVSAGVAALAVADVPAVPDTVAPSAWVVTDPDIQRFLRARKGDVEAASTMLQKTIAWRRLVDADAVSDILLIFSAFVLACGARVRPVDDSAMCTTIPPMFCRF